MRNNDCQSSIIFAILFVTSESCLVQLGKIYQGTTFGWDFALIVSLTL